MALDWSWQNAANCRGEDVVLFFGPDGERQPERDVRERKAKAICAQCPVRSECLEYALSRPEKYGTWGSLNEDERVSERRRRQRRGVLYEEEPAPAEADDKRCRDCKTVKPAADFHKDRRSDDGLNPYCKPCTNAQKRLFRDHKRRTRKKVA